VYDKKIALLGDGIILKQGAGTNWWVGTVDLGSGGYTLRVTNVANGGLMVVSNVISGNGNLQKGGPNMLTLLGANTYTGNTTISGGTLALSGSGSIANSATISVAANATLDVSTLTTALTLDSSQTLKAGGSGGASATIATASGKGLTLGATSGLQFTAYDGSTAPLTVTGSGSLTLAAGNPVHVVINHGGTPLGAGDYQLISTGTGASIAGSEPSSVVVNDLGSDGIASGLAASLRINSPGPGLYLHVYNPCTPPAVGPVSPASQAACAGSPATFTVSASGTAPLHYQWRKVGVGNVGTDSSSYTISPVATGDAGSYECEVTGQCGSPVTATAAALAVNTPPTASDWNAGCKTNQTIVLATAKLLTRATGTGLSVSAVSSPSANGGQVVLNTGAGTIAYTAPGIVGVDTFTYTISDVNGCTVSPTIYVTNAVNSGGSPNVVSGPTYANGKFSVTFAGIPDYTYTVEYAEGSAAPPWTKLKNVIAGTNGLFVVEDAVSQSPSRYYRTVSPSY